MWTLYAGSASRTASTDRGPSSINSPSWVFSTDAQGRAVQFVGQSSPVVSRDLVLAIGSVVINTQRQFRLFAIDRRTSQQAWAAPIPAPTVDSWSSPALDLDHKSVIVAIANTITSLALSDGHVVWQRTLTRNVVNASPLVTSRTTGEGLGFTNRVFITEYDGFGGNGRLTCINTDAYHPALNPFLPGEIVWSVVIGSSSGNSCALWHNLVLLANAGEDAFAPGRIMAFDARATNTPQPLWIYENPAGFGFFGGVCVHESAGRPWVYAASYDFYGGIESGNLVKLDAQSGEPAWSIPCNRSVSTPLVLPDGRVLLSAGVNGFGTIPNLQLFRDDGAGATPLWDSALNTWNDINHNGVLDLGEYFYVGGWTHQPVIATQSSRTLIYSASPPTSASSFNPCTDLYALDVAALPTQPGDAGPNLVSQHFVGAGSSPAIANENLYTIGASGLFAFGPTPFQYDVNADGLVDIEDLYSWEQSSGARDINLDGAVTQSDRAALIEELRRYEARDMLGGGAN